VAAYLGSYGLFLAATTVTHALVGYTLGATLFDRPYAGLVGGVVADLDLLFPAAWGPPLVHRGITHTALAAVVVVGTVAWWDRQAAGGVGVGYASQLLLDATTAKGVPLAYPLSAEPVGVHLRGHSAVGTLLLVACCLAVLWRRRYRS